MLDKNWDMAIVGQTLASYMLAGELVDLNKRVLMVDDHRMRYGQWFDGLLGLLEISVLKTWGEDKSYRPLAQIDNYCHRETFTFLMGNTFLQLGGEPFANLAELGRKLIPGLSSLCGELRKDTNKVNREYYEWVERLGPQFLRYETSQNITVETFKKEAPAWVNEALEILRQEFANKKDWHGVFFYTLRIFYQGMAHFRCNDVELVHLFCCLLSPLYHVDRDRLQADCLGSYEEKGGHFKKTQIREWDFYKDRPWSVELASYEGIVHPQTLALFGSRPSQIDMRLANVPQYYRSLNGHLLISGRLNEIDTGNRFIGAFKEGMGGDICFWEFIIESTSKVNFQIFRRYVKGLKEDEYGPILEDQIKKQLNILYPGIIDSIVGMEALMGDNIILDGRGDGLLFKDSRLPICRSVKMVHYKTPKKGHALKGVHYYGPFQGGPFGFLSTLMDIKDGKTYL